MKIAPGVMCFIVDHPCEENLWRVVEVSRWVNKGEIVDDSYYAAREGWLVKADDLVMLFYTHNGVTSKGAASECICKPEHLMPIKGDENLFKREMIEGNLNKYSRKLAEA